MNFKAIYFAIVLNISFSCSASVPTDYVNPFICTQGDHGHWHPSALYPFGLVKLGPDTYPSSLTGHGDLAHSGYNYSDTMVRGFSHFHRGSSGGTGRIDRSGQLSIIPFASVPDDFFANPYVPMDKQTERAIPGFYSVSLKNPQIGVTLAATPHVGLHQYSISPDTEIGLFLNEGNRKKGNNITFKLIDSYTVQGVQGKRYHFVMRFNHPVENVWIWSDNKKHRAPTEGAANGLIFEFGKIKDKTLLVKTGVSLTSTDAAKKNMNEECPDWKFAQKQKKALRAWDGILNKIEIEGNEEYKTIFYTALYHTCFLPVNITDVAGTYPGLDRRIHQATSYHHYNDYAFWDSFRTKYPLYSLFLPGVYQDIVKSIRDMYEQADNWAPFPNSTHKPHGAGMFLARGRNGYQVYTTCRHEHMLMVVADAWVKNIAGLEIENLYPHLKNETLLQMPPVYDSIGYIPGRPDQTGEYCWDNWTIAQIAKYLGNVKDYEYYLKRANYWKNTWDDSIMYFRARATDGVWLDFPDDPAENREKYTYEGSKWQWRWNILHDIPGMIDEFHGKQNFVKELETFFENDLYTAGNQIDLHAPFLFNSADAPWLAQKWVRKILTEPIVQKYGTHNLFPEPIFDRVYKATPDGYLREMDDDYGCMAAWYVMSAMGMYQICPGNPVYQLTAPIFPKVKLRLDNSFYPGKEFVIEAKDLDNENIYIQSAILNGKPFNRAWISHKEITAGGKLVYIMGDKPNKRWGTEK